MVEYFFSAALSNLNAKKMGRSSPSTHRWDITVPMPIDDASVASMSYREESECASITWFLIAFLTISTDLICSYFHGNEFPLFKIV